MKPSEISPGEDPNFAIISHSDPGFSKFNRKTVVFGIDIYAAPKVEDLKLLHASNVLAQYLDNDENGTVDDSLVWKKMIENRAFLVMWADERDLRFKAAPKRMGQDLGNDETFPSFSANGMRGPFDASLEEVLHLINYTGHAQAYPEAFGLHAGSALLNAMDKARGGRFIEIPKVYPLEAWYSYDDKTCAYEDCQAIEYLYWSITSMLGAQRNRLDEIKDEWRLNTLLKLKERDPDIYALLKDPKYHMPKILPDGQYRKKH
jgi:hypothetical protein